LILSFGEFCLTYLEKALRVSRKEFSCIHFRKAVKTSGA